MITSSSSSTCAPPSVMATQQELAELIHSVPGESWAGDSFLWQQMEERHLRHLLGGLEHARYSFGFSGGAQAEVLLHAEYCGICA